MGSIHIWFSRLGITSVFPASCGTQKLCTTSADSSLRKVGRRFARFTHRHVQLIGGYDAELRVANFPPPLVADHRDIERVGRRDSALYIVDRARRGQKEHKDGHNRNHCPGEFELIAAVDLRRFMTFISGPLAKPQQQCRVSSPATTRKIPAQIASTKRETS